VLLISLNVSKVHVINGRIAQNFQEVIFAVIVQVDSVALEM